MLIGVLMMMNLMLESKELHQNKIQDYSKKVIEQAYFSYLTDI